MIVDMEKKFLKECLGIDSDSTSEVEKDTLPVPILDLSDFTEDKGNKIEWQNPEPISVILPVVQKMQNEMIPESLRPWLFDTANRMKCPLDYVVISAILSAGSIIGARCAIHPKQKDNWLVVPNLWGVIIGEPSQLKTPATSEILKLFFSLENDAREIFKSAATEHKVTLDLIKVDSDELKKESKQKESDREKIKSKLISLEEKLHSKGPCLKRYKVADTTPEKMAELCSENPGGLLLFRDELMGLLKTLDKQGCEHHRAFYLESWSGTSSYTVDRVIKGHFYIERLCISILGGTQPDKIKSYLNEMINGSNDGLLQRFQLMIYPDSVKMEYVDKIPDKGAKEKAYSIFKKLAEIKSFESYGASCTFAGEIPSMRFTHEAQKIFIEWWEDLHKILQEDDLSPYLKEHFSKYRSLMPSLALIFHLLDTVEEENQFQSGVSENAASLAVLWCDYLISHAKRVYNGLGRTKIQSAVELSKKISSGKISEEFSVRDIQQKCWHLLDTRESIQSAIFELIEAGWLIEIQPITNSLNGRPLAPKYKINPKARNYYSNNANKC